MGVSTGMEASGSITRVHGFHPLRVSRIIAETAEAVSVVLDVPDHLIATFAYRAGQFLTFRWNVDGRPYLRSYSMSSSPEVDAELQVTVKRVVGGIVSNWIVDSLSPGDIVESTRPAGVFCLRPAGGDVLAFAGGSGITPVFSLMKTALETTTRIVRLLYANRDRDATIFAAEIDSLCARFGDRLGVVHHLDSVNGFVDAATIASYASATSDAEVFICGPGPFMDLVETTLHGQGIEPASIHIERFTPMDPPEIVQPVEQTAAAAAQALATQVTVELDGKVATTDHRSGTTILQTARQMGLTPPYSCEAGDCATCMARLVEGSAQMRANNALTGDEVEEGWVLTCQAVPDPPSVRVVYGYGED